MQSFLYAALLVSIFGCGNGGKALSKKMASIDSGEPETEPTDGLEAIDLSTFRALRQTTLSDAVSPTDMVLDPKYGPALVLDRAAGRVWGTDALFLHDPRMACIDNSSVRNSSPPNPGGQCPAGTDATSRGAIETPSKPVAIAMIPTGGTAASLDENGQITWISTNPLEGTAYDYMRAMTGPEIPLDDIEEPILSITIDEIAVAIDRSLKVFDHSGALLQDYELNDAIVDIRHHDSEWWALSANQLQRQDEVVGEGGLQFLEQDQELWVVSEMALTQVSGGSEIVDVTDAIGPAVKWGNQFLVLTDQGIWATENQTLVWNGAATTIGANDAHELVVLQPDGVLHVFVDETAYADTTKLHTWISTFIEKPRNPESEVPCRGEGESIDRILEQANSNLELLMDLPAQTTVGITPSHWKRAAQCDATESLSRLTDQLEVGVLFHHAPTECASNQACYADALSEDLNTFSIDPAWVSGLGVHTDLGIDWIQALKQIEAPNRFAFFGMSTRPDIPHDSDIRAKDSWPSSLSGQTQTWAADDIMDITSRSSNGWLSILPGDNIPAFNLGGCANLFLNECHPLGRGNGGEINEEDVRSLDLLLHRALNSAQVEGTHTWNFHLPDIGLYDYTDECEVNEGLWVGEECEGARLQNWLFDVHQRFAIRGLIEWSTPGTLVLP